ncbi:amidohydrolase family protein [Lysobacter korlensis]|uniref:Amidohydrolase family protein n=1 Tax=Lysobacter korlensis TaxID=553636 RepID=A0ABV6RUF7_9GAMM
MKTTVVLFAAALIGSQITAAHADEAFTVIRGGSNVGHLKVDEEAGRVRIDYDYKSNGRGPTMVEELRLGPDGLPRSWTISGATTFGSKVSERFEQAGSKATWTDSVGSGSATVSEPSLYVGQSASPWALGMYARALLADADNTMPTLPGGSIRVEPGETMSVSGKGGTVQVRAHAISGIDLHPSYVLLDQDNELFAYIAPAFIVVREGFESEEQRLRDVAAQLGTKRFESIQKQTAHRFEAPLRIRNVRVFDPKTLALTAPVSVRVEGERITGVDPLEVASAPGEVVIDGAGGTLVPGLMDMHGHVSQDAALLNIAAGVTTMRDMGNDNAVLDKLIERIEAGTIAGPRIVRSGMIEGKSPFNTSNGILVENLEQALDAVRWYADRGYWQVKLYNSMKPEYAKPVVAEAHRLGLRVAGHVPAFANADAMVEAGFDELTHINQILLGWVLEPNEDTRTLLRLTALRRLPPLDLQSERVQRTIGLIAENNVAVEPTIGIHEFLLLNRDGQTPAGMADYIDHLPMGAQRDAKRAWSDMSAPGDAEAYQGAYAKLLDTLRMMRERGIQLIPGTDTGGALTFHRELELFQQIGFSAPEALKLATLDMARYLGRGDSLGSIEAGKLADFFLVPGDPTRDLKAIKKISMVVSDGVTYFPSEIYPHFGVTPFANAPEVTLPKRTQSGGVD